MEPWRVELYRNELYHHGILGMRWGKRNGPPYPLGAEDHSASEKKAGWRKSLDGGSGNKKSSGIKKKLESIEKSRRQKLTSSYRQKGMNEQDAETAAKKRIRVEKIIAGAAGLTVVAAAAYAAHNAYAKEFTGRVLRAGTKFHTITGNENKSMNKVFYAAFKNRDRIIYKGLYGNQIAGGNGGKVFDITMKATRSIKVPGRREAARVFSDLYKNDSDFRDKLLEVVRFMKQNSQNDTPKQKELLSMFRLSGSMSDQELLKYGYDVFNTALVVHGGPADAMSQKFYDKLKQLGYNAILDLNDSKYSGFKADAPVIVFDFESLVKDSVERLTADQLANNQIGQDLIRNGASYAAALGLAVGGGAMYAKAVEDTLKRMETYDEERKQSRQPKKGRKTV